MSSLAASESATSQTCLSSDGDDLDADDIEVIVEAVQNEIPTAYTTKSGGKRRRIFSIKLMPSRPSTGNDATDYLHKFNEDPEFEEMGENSRFWKMLQEEHHKYDNDMVDDWKDGLDVILAGLFCSVVGSFLSQTSQKLQADPAVIGSSLLYELTSLVRVLVEKTDGPDVPHSPLNPSSAASPSLTDIWVNGLWFTSLTLSLSTALLAGLTKQWIYQYMIVPSGSPRSRGRIRQFRFDGLIAWRVPMIIGFLPVLMNLALGIFLAGLVLYLRNVNVGMAFAINSIACATFLIYVGTTILPIFLLDCPYKTPLTHHTYSTARYLRVAIFIFSTHVESQIRTHFARLRGRPDPFAIPSDEPLHVAFARKEAERKSTEQRKLVSLRFLEQQAVEREANIIDGRALSWIQNVSSNSSVHAIVREALSNMAMRGIEVVRTTAPVIADTIWDLLHSDKFQSPNHSAEVQNTYGRLFRSFSRLDTGKFLPSFDFHTASLVPGGHYTQSLTALLDVDNPEYAVTFLRSQLSDTSSQLKLDVHLWARVIQNAMRSGTSWLHVDDSSSGVWTGLLRCLIRGDGHGCQPHTNCDGSRAYLDSIPFNRTVSLARRLGGTLPYDDLGLQVLDAADAQSPVDMAFAIRNYMLPSLSEIFLKALYPTRCVGQAYEGLPHDIRFELALLQSPSIHSVQTMFGRSLALDILAHVQEYVGARGECSYMAGGTRNQHPQVLFATFDVLSSIVLSAEFLTDDIPFDHKHDIMHALSRTLVPHASLSHEQVEQHELRRQFAYCLTNTTLIETIIVAIFQDYPAIFNTETVAELLEISTGTDQSLSALGLRIYSELFSRNWLEILGSEMMMFSRQFMGTERKTASNVLLVSAYVRGLDALCTKDKDLYARTSDQIGQEQNLRSISTVL